MSSFSNLYQRCLFEKYWRTLDLEDFPTEDAIKKSYRRLAMRYHPDRNPGNRDAEEKFKDVSEAYDVLTEKNELRRFSNSLGGYSDLFSQMITLKTNLHGLIEQLDSLSKNTTGAAVGSWAWLLATFALKLYESHNGLPSGIEGIVDYSFRGPWGPATGPLTGGAIGFATVDAFQRLGKRRRSKRAGRQIIKYGIDD
jgi:hypothetical protein